MSAKALRCLYYLLLIARCLLYLALAVVVTGSCAILLIDDALIPVLMTVLVLVVLSIPFSATALLIACWQRLVSPEYVVFTLLFCLVLKPGVCIIPFLLWRDLWVLERDQSYGYFESLFR